MYQNVVHVFLSVSINCTVRYITESVSVGMWMIHIFLKNILFRISKIEDNNISGYEIAYSNLICIV